MTEDKEEFKIKNKEDHSIKKKHFKIGFVLTSEATMISNVIAICRLLKKSEYLVLIVSDTSMRDCILSLKKWKIEYRLVFKNLLNSVSNEEILEIPYWVLFNNKGSEKRKLISQIKKNNGKIISMQVGIMLYYESIVTYRQYSDYLITWGKNWENTDKRNCDGIVLNNIIPLGFPKLDLYKDLSKKYFIIFSQPFKRFNLDKVVGFRISLFYSIIVESILEIYGKDTKIHILQHPVEIYRSSEKDYIDDIIQKYRLIKININDSINYINNMKVGFTFCSAMALELMSINKDIILVNTSNSPDYSNENYSRLKFFDFKKYGFKIATNKTTLKKHLNSPVVPNNLTNLMEKDASKKFIDFFKSM